MKESPFFMVWRSGGVGPNYKHESCSKAEDEARRLAANHPGETFFVLAPVASVRSAQFEIERFDPDGIPF